MQPPAQPNYDEPPAGQLTAGEWSDLENWDVWNNLMVQQGPAKGVSSTQSWRQMLEPWSFAPTARVAVVVKDAQGAVAHDVPVRLVDGEGGVIWESRTNHRGEAVLMPQWSLYGMVAGQEELVVNVGQVVQPLAQLDLSKPLNITAAGSEPEDVIDLMFVIDATGSMGDEIHYLKSEMADVIDQVRRAQINTTLRVSFNFYCDDKDTFTVKSAPFSTPQEALTVLKAAPFCSGKDFPEAVDEGLEDAISNHQWSQSAKARLLFLVLDAPPHQDQEGVARLSQAIQGASAKGVRIHPVASSGVDKPTEMLLRAMAIATGSSYLFLTNDSGIGNQKIEPTIGHYRVQFLNQLLVEIILRATK